MADTSTKKRKFEPKDDDVVDSSEENSEDEEPEYDSEGDVDGGRMAEAFGYVQNLLTMGYPLNAKENALLDKVEQEEDIEALYALEKSMETRMVDENLVFKLKSVHGGAWWKKFLSKFENDPEYDKTTSHLESKKAFRSKKMSQAEEEVLSKYADLYEERKKKAASKKTTTVSRKAPSTKKAVAAPKKKKVSE